MSGKGWVVFLLPVLVCVGCRGKADLAAIEAQRGKWEHAARLYREYLKANPNDVLTLRSLSAIECYRLSQHEECAQHADHLLELMPIDSQGVEAGVYAHTMLAEAAGRANDTARVVAEMGKLADIYFNAGFWHYINEDYGKAEKLFRNVVRLQPKRVEAYLRLGILFWNKHMEDSSLVWFQRAAEVDPNNEDALINQMTIYHDQGDMDKALRLYDELTALRKRLYPDSSFDAGPDSTLPPLSLDYRGEPPHGQLPY